MNVQFSGVAQQPIIQQQPVQFSGKKIDRVKQELKKSKDAVLSKNGAEKAGLGAVTGALSAVIMSNPVLPAVGVFTGVYLAFQALSPQAGQLVDKVKNRNKDESEPTNS